MRQIINLWSIDHNQRYPNDPWERVGFREVLFSNFAKILMGGGHSSVVGRQLMILDSSGIKLRRVFELATNRKVRCSTAFRDFWSSFFTS